MITLPEEIPIANSLLTASKHSLVVSTGCLYGINSFQDNCIN